MTQRIATPSKTKEIIQANGFCFKKNFGQNFLIDGNVLENIVESAEITQKDCVLEIGPGIGSLTQILAERAKKVIAIEIDSHLIPILQKTVGNYHNIEIRNEDILKTDIDDIIEKENDGKPIEVVANLPYYITTPILMDLLENHRKVESITVMVQKEVAQRMQAKAGEKEYGALSVAVQYYCHTKMDMIVQPSCFMPKPKVASAVITLHLRKEPIFEQIDEALFFHIVKCAFGQRRKTLLNSLYNQGNLGLTKEMLIQMIQSAGLEEKVRGEALTLEQFGILTNEIAKRKNKYDIENK